MGAVDGGRPLGKLAAPTPIPNETLRMRKTTLSVCAGLLLAAAGMPALAATVSSDFSADGDGWTVTTFNDNGQPNFASPKTSELFPLFVASGGDPGGFIRIADPDDGWTYFVAPSKYIGDQSDKLGGTLRFSLQHSVGTLVGDPAHAVLKSAGRILVADAGFPPAITPEWRRYEVSLSVGHWRIGSNAGALATEQELLLTLADLDGLFLAGEFITPVVEVNGLDSVSLAPVPLPAAAWGLLSALGVLGLRRRRG